MSENELRIGNYILDPQDHVIEVSATLFVADMNPEGSWSIEDCSGIPITPEWLERLGFEKKSKEYFIKKNDKANLLLFYSEYHNKYWYFADVERKQYNSTLPFIYVHQLQNLFYSLTGQELTVKNKGENAVT